MRRIHKKIISRTPVSIKNFLKKFIIREDMIPSLVSMYCGGNGIEIGPGKNPYCSRDNTVFLDRHSSNADATSAPDIISDASSVPYPDESFDFLLSAHCLEHIPNTIRALNEWIRVLRPAGVLFLILPHGARTIDRFRERTSLLHHLEDFERLGAGSDPSHCEEIEAGWSALPDFADQVEQYERRWGARMWDWNFRFENDVIHYHVWTQDQIVRLLQFLQLEIMFVSECVAERPDSFVVVSRKLARTEPI